MASNYTTNYELPIWAAEDSFLRTEFNEANQKIDTAIAEVAAGVPKIMSGTYTGTGAYKSSYTELDVGFAPKFIYVCSTTGTRFIIAVAGATSVPAAHTNTGSYNCQLVWTETGVKWRNPNAGNADDQLNKSGATYFWLAIG